MDKEELREKRKRANESINDIKAVLGLDELYIDDLERENAELKADNDARKFAMAMSEKVEKKLRKENAELKADNDARKFAMAMSEKVEKKLRKENAELRKVAEFQQSSNMNRHFENKKLKEGLAVGSILNKGLNSLNKALEEERDKYRNMVFEKDDNLTKAKEFLNEFMRISQASDEDFEHDYSELIGEAEQFLKDLEK